MYRFFVKRNVRRGFRRISEGDAEVVAGRLAPSGVFEFAGTHALGGELRDPDAVRRLFQRMFRLFPGLRVEPQTIVVGGWPWDTVVATRFTVVATLHDGRPYRNEGMQFLRLRWGRILEDRLYEDTQKLATELDRIAREGVGEPA